MIGRIALWLMVGICALVVVAEWCGATVDLGDERYG